MAQKLVDGGVDGSLLGQTGPDEVGGQSFLERVGCNGVPNLGGMLSCTCCGPVPQDQRLLQIPLLYEILCDALDSIIQLIIAREWPWQETYLAHLPNSQKCDLRHHSAGSRVGDVLWKE